MTEEEQLVLQQVLATAQAENAALTERVASLERTTALTRSSNVELVQSVSLLEQALLRSRAQNTAVADEITLIRSAYDNFAAACQLLVQDLEWEKRDVVEGFQWRLSDPTMPKQALPTEEEPNPPMPPELVEQTPLERVTRRLAGAQQVLAIARSIRP